jgi:hypothetical protein
MDIKKQAVLEYLTQGFVPGWTNNEFPAFANTRTLGVIVEHYDKDYQNKKNEFTRTYYRVN